MKLTLPQEDVFFEQLRYPDEPIYNIGAKIEIEGHINLTLLQKAYAKLINQHDAYRTIFIYDQGNVSSQVLDRHESELGFIDFSTANDPLYEATQYVQKEFIKPFNLFDGSVLHVFTLLKIKEDFHYLFSVYHHIITDGWGTSLMFQRIVQNYNEIIEFGEVKTLYPFSYNEFIEDDEIYRNADCFDIDKNYWVEKFKTLPDTLFEKMDETIQINKSSRRELIIKRSAYNQLNNLATAYKCSTFHIILALLFTYFGRKHQNLDFAIGLPVLNRNKSKYKKTVGLFMGISPLRMSLNFEISFMDLVTEIKNQLRTDYRYQRFPVGKLIKELQLFMEKERLFNITLSYEKQNYANDFINTKTRVIPLTHQSERVGLAIYIREFDELEDVKIDFDYNLNYFNDTSITKVVQHFENLMEAILIKPEKKIKELNYLSPEETHQLLKQFNDTTVNYQKDKTFIDLFKIQAKLHADKMAISDECRSYSYAELDNVSSQIAACLISDFGAEEKSPVAVLLNRSAQMVAVLLGILKSRRPYIPLDPVFPQERLNYIIDNSECKVLIVEEGHESEKMKEVRVLTVETVLIRAAEFQEILLPVISPDDTSYIIYTSGSTGNPKGVEIGHQSLFNFLTSIQQKPGFLLTDKLFSVTTYSFDISILEFFVPLISGADLYIAAQTILSDPNLIIQKLNELQPTIIQATPAFYQMLYNAGWEGNKKLKVFCGGDLLKEALAEKLLRDNREVWNMYGPTETTIWSGIKKIDAPKDASNIGKPINNTQFYILDTFLSPKPVGALGEIYIGGDGLAKGYYKNDQLTKSKFIKNPFDNANSLIYETGDIGKWNDKGEIEFSGRKDNQVKIRGYRIELGDIESKLNQIEGIDGSVVITKKEEEQESLLVAYILESQKGIEHEKILNDLKMSLPHYMIPNVIIALEAFPLTPNQKIDRKNLSQKPIQQRTTEKEFKPPASYLEKKLSVYWKEVLKRSEPISSTDNFFALGGQSLNAVKLIGLISKGLSVTISLKTIFDYSTIESLANYLEKYSPAPFDSISLAVHKEFYPLTPPQYAIWLASQQKSASIAYNMFTAYKLDGIIDIERIMHAVNEMINKYEILRTNFIEINGGPYQKINSPKSRTLSIAINHAKGRSIDKEIKQFATQEFDLENELLIRIQLLHAETDQLLLFNTHHLVMDGLSLEIFIMEFIQNYKEGTNLKKAEENALKFQFKDYSEWYNKTLNDALAKNKLFWKNYLQNYETKYLVDRDHDSKHNQQNGSHYQFELTFENTLALKKLALKEQVTFYAILATALKVLIYKRSGYTDICIGIVNSGRNIPELNHQIGMFAKSLILRTEIRKNQPFHDLLKNTHANLAKVNDHQDIPSDGTMQSFIDMMMVYQNPEFSFENLKELNDVKLTHYPVANAYSRLPVVINMFEYEDKLKGTIDYNSDLYEESTIQIIASGYDQLLSEIIKNPFASIDQLGISPKIDKTEIFGFEFNF